MEALKSDNADSKTKKQILARLIYKVSPTRVSSFLNDKIFETSFNITQTIYLLREGAEPTGARFSIKPKYKDIFIPIKSKEPLSRYLMNPLILSEMLSLFHQHDKTASSEDKILIKPFTDQDLPTLTEEKWLHSKAGKLTVREFPLAHALELFIKKGTIKKSDIEKAFEREKTNLLSDTKAFQMWVATFIEADLEYHLNSLTPEEQQKFFADLAKSEGRVKGFENGEFIHEDPPTKRETIDPIAASNRRQHLCSQVFALPK